MEFVAEKRATLQGTMRLEEWGPAGVGTAGPDLSGLSHADEQGRTRACGGKEVSRRGGRLVVSGHSLTSSWTSHSSTVPHPSSDSVALTPSDCPSQ